MDLGKKDTVLESETDNKQRPADGCRAPRLLLSRSTQTTRNNRTGDWRFVRPIFEDKTAPCSVACPVGEDIPRIEMLAARGQFRQAWEAVMQENPFPATCGRVCFHPCEGACNRSEFDAPLAIHHVERYLGEHALKENLMPPVRPAKANGKRVAIVGAGPSGLSAAYFLTNLGYQCHVYEAQEEAGGLLRWGIPEYRLPLRILAGETSRLERLGVHVHRQTPVARDILDGAGGDVRAVFVGCGHARSVFPGIEGQSLMLDGLEYLRAVRSGAAPDISGDVVVIGGGNTAIDVARSLVRGDARPVILYRRRLADMPVFEQEREAALAEGVRIRELVAPVSVEADRGRLRLSVQAMRPSGERAGDGRSRVVPTGGETRVLTVDKVFAATGAEADAAWAPGRETEYMRLELSHCLLELRAFPVLYGGDLASPVQSVTHALMSGKQASMALDTYFQAGIAAVAPRLAECRVGEGPAVSMEKYHSSDARRASPQAVVYADINSSLFDRSERGTPPQLSPECRVRSFSAVEACLAGEEAVQEANRCFSCGTCNGCGYCRLFCPEMAVALGARRTIDLDYCKGCGICVAECPRNAMRLEAEAP
jgi:NADPH-dependent glutamate synthase beta subunit-like oxidoreductase/ferredoxin